MASSPDTLGLREWVEESGVSDVTRVSDDGCVPGIPSSPSSEPPVGEGNMLEHVLNNVDAAGFAANECE
jgi:hypothetical protein